MPIVVDCSSCHRKLRIPDELLGKLVKCPTCNMTFTATALASPVAAAGDPASAAPPPSPPPAPAAPPPIAQQRPMAVAQYQRPTGPPPGTSSGQRPGKVQAVAIMTLVGGILATVNAVVMLMIMLIYGGIGGLATGGIGFICCLYPPPYYGVVLGIMGIIKGAALLGQQGHMQTAPKGIAIMQIINIINFDVPNCVMGIITLVFMGDPEVGNYYPSPADGEPGA